MTGHIWLPVNTPEMKNFAKEMNEGRRASGKPEFKVHVNASAKGKMKAVRRKLGGGCLKGVQGKLYIIVHGGGKGSASVGASRSGILKKYSPNDLAKAAEAEGLGKKIRDVRMYACGSAVAPKGMAPFGARFAESLRNLGYDNVKVTGYLGSLYAAAGTALKKGSSDEYHETKHRTVLVDSMMRRASEYKKVF